MKRNPDAFQRALQDMLMDHAIKCADGPMQSSYPAYQGKGHVNRTEKQRTAGRRAQRKLKHDTYEYVEKG